MQFVQDYDSRFDRLGQPLLSGLNILAISGVVPGVRRSKYHAASSLGRKGEVCGLLVRNQQGRKMSIENMDEAEMLR